MVQLDLLRELPLELKLAAEDISPQLFDKIANCAEKEQLDEMEELIPGIFEGGNFDIRVISYYLYAHFLKVGVKSFKETLPIFIRLVNDHFEILRPVHRKEKQIENSFNWFFVHVLNKLKYNEKLFKEKKTSFWDLSQVQLSESEFAELSQIMANFSHFFDKRWDQSSTKERVAHVFKKVEDLKLVVIPEEGLKEVETEEEKPAVELPGPDALDPQPGSSSQFFDSIPLMGLMEKLKVFEKLVEKNDFLKAAIVSADLTETIAHFDPCYYFPKLFATYFNLVAKSAEMLSQASENREALQWKALERLYKADIDQFSDWELS